MRARSATDTVPLCKQSTSGTAGTDPSAGGYWELEMVPQARLTGDSGHNGKVGDSARWMEEAAGPGNSHGWAV